MASLMVRSVFCALALVAMTLPPVAAAELEAPVGPVVVTVAGNIESSNRPSYDPKSDLFLKYHEKTFEKAVAFDYAMLEALGLHEVEAKVPAWSAPVRLEGPRLVDLLAAVGGTGKTVTLVALDGYASEISWAEVTSLDWIIGIRRDGKYLGLGQQGPLWVVYTYPDGRALSDDDELRWPWAAFYIQID